MTSRIFFGLSMAGALVVLLIGWSYSQRQVNQLTQQVARHGACVAAVGSPNDAQAMGEVAQTCEPAIVAADKTARQAKACEGALQVNVTQVDGATITATNGSTVLAVCSAEVGKLFRQTVTDAASIIGLRGSLAAARQDANQAVARAEARGRSQAERESRARALRESAPRDSDGLRVYDAERLRERWEAEP